MSPENIYTRPHNLFATPDISPDANRDEWRQPGDVQILLYPYYSTFDAHELIKIARALVSPRGKGIYATDEAPYAMDDLLASLDEDPTLKKSRTEEEKRERRKKWRECMYSATPTGKLFSRMLYIYVTEKIS